MQRAWALLETHEKKTDENCEVGWRKVRGRHLNHTRKIDGNCKWQMVVLRCDALIDAAKLRMQSITNM